MSKPSRSKLWFLVHSWLALPIWAFVCFICATGTIAVISQEIVWLLNPAVRASAPDAQTPRMGYQALYDSIQKQVPEAAIQSLSWPEESQFALTARVSYPGARTTSLYVNPYTGVVQGPSLDFDLRQFMRALHGWLLIPFTNGFSWGWYLVSALSIPMFASLVTGLVVYKRFWRAFFKPRLRLNQGARIFWGDFHRLAGLWSIWFILLISVSAMWFLAQAILFDTHTTISTQGVPAVVAREEAPTVPRGQPVPRLDLDRIVAAARQELPSMEPQRIAFSGNAYDPVTVMGRGGYPLMFQSAQINPYNGKAEAVRRLSDRSALEYFTESMRPLHTGDFGGFWLKLVWFFFGLLLTMMSVSGMLIWTKRTAQATAKAVSPRRQRAPRPAAAPVAPAREAAE
ncbi:PepSY domain-containing protein [Orrella sp. JC864]|uniref:PepSY-associated TM helix domain-containing protein n=1 Tax=Orrella sp. JC864 TaxID=3120298 RepID=UPI0012BD0306